MNSPKPKQSRYQTEAFTDRAGKAVALKRYNFADRYNSKYRKNRINILRPVQLTENLCLCPFCWRVTYIAQPKTDPLAPRVRKPAWQHLLKHWLGWFDNNRTMQTHDLNYKHEGNGKFLVDLIPVCAHCHLGPRGGALNGVDSASKERSVLHRKKVWYQCKFDPDSSHQRDGWITLFRWQVRLAVVVVWIFHQLFDRRLKQSE